jgi:tRNA 2-thiouridine synthesizing protein C
MMKKILFIMRSLPHQGIQLQEKLDVILTAAAFDQSVSLLFLDDGVFQLKIGQQPEEQQLKDTASIFNVLDMYDVTDLYVESESLQQRGLALTDLSLPMKALGCQEVGGLIKQFDIVIAG